MNIWHLPGPAEYLGAVERSLRDGESVVLQFPGGTPTGIETALHVRLGDSWRWECIEAGSSVKPGQCAPLNRLFERFAPELAAFSGLTAVELCEAEGFQGRLIWIEGLHSANWHAWKAFLTRYAQASRSVSRLRRTLFVAPVEDDTSEESDSDVALMVHDWTGAVDEMDVSFLVNDRIRRRRIGGTLRTLLVMTIARVVAWDCGVAERLANSSVDDILNPLELLGSVARERGWTLGTSSSVLSGTESRAGVMHAALAAITEPSEIQRRIWSAQVSVLLPVIELQRREIIRQHRHQIEASIQQPGTRGDAEALEIGELAHLFWRVGFDHEVSLRVEELRLARNELAHGQPLPPAEALALVRMTASIP